MAVGAMFGATVEITAGATVELVVGTMVEEMTGIVAGTTDAITAGVLVSVVSFAAIVGTPGTVVGSWATTGGAAVGMLGDGRFVASAIRSGIGWGLFGVDAGTIGEASAISAESFGGGVQGAAGWVNPS